MRFARCSKALMLALATTGCFQGAAQGQTAAVPAARTAKATQDSAANALLMRYQSAKDPSAAQRAFDELAAIAEKSPRAAYLCGVLASQPGSIVANRATALRCFEVAAKAGTVEAQHGLAVLLIAEKPTDPKKRAAAELWLARAAKRLPESVYLLALLKTERAPDPERARREVVERAAEAGFAPAQYEFARQLFAQGNAESNAAARVWLEKAAAQQYSDASVDLAMVIESDGREQDVPRIVALLEAASEAGSPRGDHALGLRLMHGKGVKSDPERAFELFRRAASRGNIPAMYATGFALSEGVGTGSDEAAAVEWYRRAADRGYADAMFALGNSYANGWGVGKNIDVAYRWYCKAAQAGNVQGLDMMRHTLAGQCAIEPR